MWPVVWPWLVRVGAWTAGGAATVYGASRGTGAVANQVGNAAESVAVAGAKVVGVAAVAALSGAAVVAAYRRRPRGRR